VNDKEAIDMMQRCVEEFRSLRAQIEHLAPLADAYTVLRDVVRLAAPRSGATASVDLIWILEKRIRELEPKAKADTQEEPPGVQGPAY
jgi:hypothetical protein